MVRVVSSSPDQGNSPTYDLAILGILGARERLDIASAYFVPPYNLRRAILSAARRSVRVRLLVPGVTDVRLVREMGLRFYGELLEAGVRIYEWQTPILHAKTMVADGKWLVVGSANMDSRSYFLNYESCLALSDPAVAREAHADFDKDVEAAVELTLEKWRRRGARQKTLERVLVPVAGQY
ncbi:MAG: phospholipase D-like domain-containing protein [Planctomycetes bacterium]|nr:phospholipase D-like domain-containing protein [Planctomycetota bacterium]